jgi:hypothetical protein
MRARPSDFRPERPPTRRPPAAGHLGSQERARPPFLPGGEASDQGDSFGEGPPRSAPWLLPPPPLSRAPRQVGSRCIPKRIPGANFAPSASRDLSRTALAGLSLFMEAAVRSPHRCSRHAQAEARRAARLTLVRYTRRLLRNDVGVRRRSGRRRWRLVARVVAHRGRRLLRGVRFL